MDKKLILDSKEYDLVNTYDNMVDANRDADEFNHTSRWHAIVKQVGDKHELYARKVTIDARAH